MRLRTPLHGRSHLPQGSDPIPWTGFIRYDFLNVGDWLSIEATDGTGPVGPDPPPPRMQGNTPNIVIKSDSDNAAGLGILLWAHDTVLSRDPVWQFTVSGSYYFLNGQDDLGYTEGGDIIRYSGGGNILFYTTDGDLNGAGDFTVITSGALNDDVGDISLYSTGGDGGGDIILNAGDVIEIATENGASTGRIDIHSDEAPITIRANGGDGTGAITLAYGPSGTLAIKQGFPSTPVTLMEFQADGTIHIQTGATIIADL